MSQGRETIRIVVAGEPQGKGRPRFTRQTGHAFTPARTRSYEAVVRFAAQETMGERPPFEGAVSVSIHAGQGGGKHSLASKNRNRNAGPAPLFDGSAA